MKRGWKKALGDRCRAILNAAEFDAPIGGGDDEFLRDILERHPEASEKIGVGVACFDVRRNGWGGRTFWVVRVDGSATDFSFLSCLTPPTPLSDFLKACRTAVVPDVMEAKNRAFDGQAAVVCPVTGEPITRDTAHIDHAPPWTFRRIAEAFAAEFLSLDGLVEPTIDGETVTRFASPATAERFRTFHAERANLRAVSRRANLSVLQTRH